MKTKISIFLFTIVIFICCKTTSKTPPPVVSLAPDQKDESVAKAKWPDADLAQLNSGYTIYQANCGRCHELHKPNEFDEAGWTKWVGKMGPKAKLNSGDQQLILHYLVAKHDVMMSK